MKVLYINNYKDGTGWANAGQQYILALDAAGVDVVPRHIKLNPAKCEVDERVLAMEKKDASGCDVVIQHVLPHFLDYRGEFDENIALYHTETDNIERCGWSDYINQMDRAIVSCRDSREASYDSNVAIQVHTIPVPCDPSKYSQRWDKIEFPELRGKFIFYFIGEITRRKNLVALLKAFHLEFEPDEPVGLLIKANYPGLSPADTSQKVVEMSRDVKKQLKKFKDINLYKGEVIVAQTLTNEQIMQIHAGCDCFVMPSFGEGWSIPAFDAMAMGNTPICTNQGGAADFLRCHGKHAGWLVPGYREPCFGMADCAVPEIYTGMENWYNIDVIHLRKAMRQAFEDKEQRKEKAALGIDRAYDFSYEAVGHQLKEFLNGREASLSDRAAAFYAKHNVDFLRGKHEG
jgi:glycosyltransferase involved in cell wall biosynthesis